jgi:hypothetical protein
LVEAFKRLNSTQRIFQVDRKEIHYLRFTLESYDGMALVSTIDPYLALIEVSMAPGCEQWVYALMNALEKNEGLSIKSLHRAEVSA